jgi:hypothetical protein
MSWSFEILGGDLSPLSDQTGLGVVTARAKTLQDLKSALYEAMGTDPMHPDYGSLIDGGRLPDGTVVQSLIGSDSSSIYRIQEEVSRVIRDFTTRQNARIKSDIANFGRTTVSDGEIIDRVSSVATKLFGSKLVVQVNLVMRNSNTITITQPLG